MLAFTETLWNCSVASPSFSDVITVGIDDSQRLQLVRSSPESPRESQLDDVLANVPLVRTTPPSEPMNATLPSPVNTIACWSGCMPIGGDCESSVMSVKLTPAFVERCTARPFEGAWR